MRKYLAAALAATLAISAPAVAFAAQGAKAKPAATHKAAEKTAKGTVKSIDTDSVVLTTKKGEMKFKLDAMAKHDGVAAGSMATVHYKMDGKDMVATGVMVSAAPTATKKKK